MIVLHCRKPRFLSLQVCKVSALYYGPKNNNFQANCTAGAIFVLCFFLFLNPDAEIMRNLLFNTLLKITPHNTQKEEEEKKEQRMDL